MIQNKHLSVLIVVATLANVQPTEGLQAKTIEVGPEKTFAKLSLALSAAGDGDLIQVDAKGKHDGDVCLIRTSNLTIRGIGKGMARFPAAGKSYGRKGIWVIRGNNVTVENIEFSGARVPDRNGAGIRAEGKNLTVRNCKFHDCEDGILGGAGDLLIEHCEFSHCGLNGQAHNLYIGHADKLTFRYNYSHHAKAGHLLKSRARENHILCNYLSDGVDGRSSYVINLPNGGKSFLIGNVLCQGPKTQNSTLVSYGEEGVKYSGSELYIVNNTMVNNRHTCVFINARRVSDAFKLVAKNNIFAGRGVLCSWPKAEMVANHSARDPLFVNRSGFDFRLRKSSPCIDKGVDPGKAGDVALQPLFQYVHPRSKKKRAVDGKTDIGAFEF